jgi:hypothetical protein
VVSKNAFMAHSSVAALVALPQSADQQEYPALTVLSLPDPSVRLRVNYGGSQPFSIWFGVCATERIDDAAI